MKKDVRLTPSQKEAAVNWFRKYAQHGFWGREALCLSNIRRAIGYEGSNQSFSKLWRQFVATEMRQSEYKANIEALNQEIKEAIENG